MPYTEALETITTQISQIQPIHIYGRVTAVKGIVIESMGLAEFASIGTHMLVHPNNGSKQVMSEVIGFDGEKVLLMAFGDIDGVGPGSRVEIVNRENDVFPDHSWLGRIVNSLGEPIDSKGPLKNGEKSYGLKNTPLPSQQRRKIGAKIA